MRAPVVAIACAWALSVGACLYPEYGVKQDGGGTAGTTGSGTGGRGGTSAGAAGTGGVAASAGRGGSGTATAGTSGGGGISGAAGSISGLAGTGGGSAGRGGTTGTAGTGAGSAGRGGTTGAAGTGAGNAGRGGTTGTAGNAGGAGTINLAGSGGLGGGTAGSGAAGRGGTTGTGGGGAGRGGTTGAGGGVAGAGGSTPPPSWLPSIAVVYQFDLGQGFIGSEAHGDETLHLEEDTNDSLLPTSDMTNFIEGKSGRLPGPVSAPAYFRSRSGAALPSVFRTEPGTSFTTGGWFRIDSALNDELQYLINDEGPANYQGGFVFYLDQRIGSFGTSAALAYCRIGTSEANFNYKEVQTTTEVGPDPVAGNRWVHLVCRFDASSNQLSIFVAGIRTANTTDTTHPIRTGPGPFMLGCDVSFCAFIGNMDEVFYATSALPDVDVNRIYACGIDGSRCRCSGTAYTSCGFAPSCAPPTLPFCNSPTP